MIDLTVEQMIVLLPRGWALLHYGALPSLQWAVGDDRNLRYTGETPHEALSAFVRDLLKRGEESVRAQDERKAKWQEASQAAGQESA